MREHIVQITDEKYEKPFWQEASELDVLDGGELVRCKDCVYWNEWLPLSPNKGNCNRHNYYSDHSGEWFCADGVKKDG